MNGLLFYICGLKNDQSEVAIVNESWTIKKEIKIILPFNSMNTALHVVLLIIIFSNSVLLMMGKSISSFKMFKLSWIIALIDILVILFFFELKQSVILYFTCTSIIVTFTIGFRNLATNYNKNSLSINDYKKRFANFFAYFLLFFLMMFTVGVMKNLLFDSPL